MARLAPIGDIHGCWSKHALKIEVYRPFQIVEADFAPLAGRSWKPG
jgi:hypothetical protein